MVFGQVVRYIALDCTHGVWPGGEIYCTRLHIWCLARIVRYIAIDCTHGVWPGGEILLL